MERRKDNNNLPTKNVEFAHTFEKSGEVHGAGAALVAIPMMLVAFIFFVGLGILMLLMGGFALLTGKPGKVNFKYYMDKKPDFFGRRHPDGAFTPNETAGEIIDIDGKEVGTFKAEDK